MLRTLDGLLAALWWSQLTDEQKEQIGEVLNDTNDGTDDLGLRDGEVN